VLEPIRRWNATRRLIKAVRQGVGLQEATWTMPPPGDDAAASRVVDQMAGWARDAMASMRRPYGIDHVAVALACRDAAGRVVCSNSLGVIRPAAFYGEDGPGRLRAFLDDAFFASPGEGAEIVAAILSLGEVAFELNGEKAA
jgi:hypothetical protein